MPRSSLLISSNPQSLHISDALEDQGEIVPILGVIVIGKFEFHRFAVGA